MSLSKSQRILVQELSCPICLHLFSKPVILPCGHSYCLACIQCAMEANKGPPHYCPECREEYPADRELQKNFSLCSIVEGYKETAAEGEAPAEAVVLCEECQGTGRPAVKTCLKCEVSLCSQHMQRHLQKESVKRHIVVEPPSPTEGVMCLLHRKAPEYFCGSDSTLLCTSCFIEGNHQDHDVKTLEIAEVEMRQVIESHRKVLQNKLQMLESLVQRGIEDEAIFKAANNKLAVKVLALLGGMAELVSGYRARLGQLLQEEQSLLEEGWQNGLRQMGDQQDLLRATQQDAALVLGETDKCIFVHRFLKVEPAIKAAIGGLVSAPVLAPIIVKKLSSSARTDSFKAEMGRMLQALHVLLSPLELTFNPNTAHQSLVISNDQRTVKYSTTKQSHPDHSERFLSAPQVLCSQGFASGEHIWVVEVGQCMWSVGLSYKSIPRRGDHSRLGHNPVSWRVQWKNRKLTACHESSNVVLPETVPPQRVEVTLDYDGGMLSFHSVMGRREHLHTFRASFREPVYPAFSIHSTTPQSWITLQN